MDPSDTRDTYIGTLERTLGLPLKPQYLGDLVLKMDDCVRVFEALEGFYATIPFSQVPEVPSSEFVPVFTADIANLIEPGSLLARIGQRFDKAESSPANRLANLVLYAPRVIISDMIGSYAGMWRDDVYGRHTDEELTVLVAEELKAIGRLSDLFDAGTIITYSPLGSPPVFDMIQDRVEMEVGVGMLDDPDIMRWVREEVASEFAEEWLQTHVGMAIQEVGESILFSKAFGFNGGPVFSSASALAALNKIVNEVSPLDSAALAEQQRQYCISSNSLVDLTQTDPRAIADIRFDSKAFVAWRTFIDESIERILELRAADAGFDQRLARDLEIRANDFERMLVAEFGETALGRCFKFDAANVIGLVASAALGLGGPVLGQVSSLITPLIVERAATFATGLSGDRLRRAMKSHYHAFVKRSD